LLRLIIVTIILSVLLGCLSSPELVPPDLSPDPAEEDSMPDTGFSILAAPEIETVDLSEPFVKRVDRRKLYTGMSMDEVLEIFPNPDRIKISSRTIEYWIYEGLELYFKDRKLEDYFVTN
jgi:hypothetical protein